MISLSGKNAGLWYVVLSVCLSVCLPPSGALEPDQYSPSFETTTTCI